MILMWYHIHMMNGTNNHGTDKGTTGMNTTEMIKRMEETGVMARAAEYVKAGMDTTEAITQAFADTQAFAERMLAQADERIKEATATMAADVYHAIRDAE